MLYLYIVRHGETEWNKEERMQGRLNSQLTSKGREYAKLLGNRLQHTEFAQVISSPSERALETTQLIGQKRNFSIITDERIMELNLGDWQGMTLKEIQEQHCDEYDCFMNTPHCYKKEDAETFYDLQERAQDFLSIMENSPISGNVLVVTHGLFIKSLFQILEGTNVKDFWSEPTVEGTSLSIIKMDEGKAEIVLKGDMQHVDESKIRG
jgi:broad specificity phosphatase PhoE